MTDRVCVLFQCQMLYEKYEEVLENFWFKHYAQKKKTELREYLCINRVRGRVLICNFVWHLSSAVILYRSFLLSW